MGTSVLIAFSVSGAVSLLISLLFSYNAYNAKGNRYSHKEMSRDYVKGSFKHFWYANRFKLWWYLAFVMLLLGGALLAAVFASI